MSLSSLQDRLGEIEVAKEEANTLKQMLKDALESDIPFQEAEAERKDWAQKAKKAKEVAFAAANADEIQEKIAEINEKVKSMNELFSYELMEYYNEYKTNEFEDRDGNVRKFKVGAALVRSKGGEE
jgi:cell division septum initiation protein DivIVA